MAYRDSTVGTGSSATPGTVVPAGVAAGDIVLLAASIDAVGNAFDPADWPAGFTELAETDITADGHSFAVGWKRLTGADAGSYTFGSVGSSADWVCQAIAFSGRHATDPPVNSSMSVLNTPTGTSPVTVNANGVTALAGDDLIFIAAGDVSANNAGNGFTAPVSYTEAEDAEFFWSNQTIAYRENVSAGATGTVAGAFAFTNNTGYAAVLVRIPAAGGAAPTVKQLAALGVG